MSAYLSTFLSDHDSVVHELINTEFLSVLGTVLGAGDTLMVKRTDKESCSHEAHILLGKEVN